MSTKQTIEPNELDPTHSKIEFARLDGKEVSDPTWNKLLGFLVEQYYFDLVNREGISRNESIGIIAEIVGIKDGDNSGNDGWTYLSHPRLSVQGEDAIDIWREIRTLATHMAMHRWSRYMIELELRFAGGSATIGRCTVAWESPDI